MRPLYIAIGVDCDPDRDASPGTLAWRGVERLPDLLDMLPDVRWTLNVRADTQVRDACGHAGYCYDHYRSIWDAFAAQGSAIAWHLHYFDRHGRQDISEANILENIRLGSEAMGRPDLLHMGWTFQNDFSIRHLYEAGVRVDYSPAPRMRRQGAPVDNYDWADFSPRPQLWHGVRMIPAYTFPHRLLARRFKTERVLLTATTTPMLYRSLVDSFFTTGADYLVNYFHADELVPAVGGWRNRLYGPQALRANIAYLREQAERHGYEARFVNIRELSNLLFA